MAIGTGHVIAVVRATIPAETDVSVVTAYTGAILNGYGRRLVRAKADQRWSFSATAKLPGVFAARAVAGFTLHLTLSERAAGIGGNAVTGLKYCDDLLIVVTSQASISTFSAVCHLSFLCRAFGVSSQR